jgi:hypothetical protein
MDTIIVGGGQLRRRELGASPRDGRGRTTGSAAPSALDVCAVTGRGRGRPASAPGLARRTSAQPTPSLPSLPSRRRVGTRPSAPRLATYARASADSSAIRGGMLDP